MRRLSLNSLFIIGLMSAQTACAANAPASCPDQYQLVSGEVKWSGVVSPPEAHCFHSECPEPPPESRLQAVLVKPLLDGQRTDKTILAFTPEEDGNELREKPKYLDVGKVYSVCARPTGRETTTGELYYEIDDLATIKEMN